jgi:hypothetical protein
MSEIIEDLCNIFLRNFGIQPTQYMPKNPEYYYIHKKKAVSLHAMVMLGGRGSIAPTHF